MVLGLVEAMVVDVVVVVDDFLPANPSKALCLMAVVYRTAATFQYMLYLQLCEEGNYTKRILLVRIGGRRI